VYRLGSGGFRGVCALCRLDSIKLWNVNRPVTNTPKVLKESVSRRPFSRGAGR